MIVLGKDFDASRWLDLPAESRAEKRAHFIE
jgi:hypothetical protein